MSRTLTDWLRPVLTLAALAGTLALTACGGGSGAPNNPYQPGPTAPGPLTVVPSEAIAYAGTPLVLSIAGGTPPYQAFSANPSALPVTQVVSGNTIALLANNVASPQSANITIRDSGGQSALAGIEVRPAILLPASITITPNSAPCPGGDACSGQTSVAAVKATGPAGTPLTGRQVRFDVVQGQFSLQTTNPGSPLASTQTVITDSNGEARVIIAVPVATPTQIGLLRATDVSTGNQVTGQFVIAQVTNGDGVLSVAPSGTTTITGSAAGQCSAGVRVSHYIFGGTPPYRVVSNYPDAASLVGSPVTANGGGFSIITNGSCFTGLTFAITDATGRTLTTGLPTIDNVPGSQTPTPPPAAPTLVVTPQTVGVTANCTTARTYQFVITGGTPPYSVVVGQPVGWVVTGVPVASSGQAFFVAGPNSPPGSGGSIANTVTIVDQGVPQQTVSASIDCTP